MTAPSDHEAYLRAALHAAAESLDPRGDGLDLIRSRLQHARPRAVVWLLAAWDALWLRAPAALQDVLYLLGAGLRAARDRFGEAIDALAPLAPGKHHRTRTQGWLRPLAAMAVVVFIVAAGTYVAIDISTAVSPSSTNLHQHNGQPGSGGRPAGTPGPSPSRTSSGSGSGARHPSTSPSCGPSASPAPSASASCAPAASAQPSPSASAPSSPSPSPTPTGSSSPPDSPTPDPSGS
jgi:hypothetical protein